MEETYRIVDESEIKLKILISAFDYYIKNSSESDLIKNHIKNGILRRNIVNMNNLCVENRNNCKIIISNKIKKKIHV